MDTLIKKQDPEYQFRFMTSDDRFYNTADGYFSKLHKSIFVKQSVGSLTYFHELQHLIQFKRLGVTECRYSNKTLDKKDIVDDFYNTINIVQNYFHDNYIDLLINLCTKWSGRESDRRRFKNEHGELTVENVYKTVMVLINQNSIL